jgi:hypothetical protein
MIRNLVSNLIALKTTVGKSSAHEKSGIVDSRPVRTGQAKDR